MISQDVLDFLEKLRDALAEPWTLEQDLIQFFELPEGREFIRGGEATAHELLEVVRGNVSAPQKRVAILALSRFSPELFYLELLAILEGADVETVWAFDSGLWLVRLPPGRVARDLMELVKRSHNPHPLLLLQRPAAKYVKSDLEEIIERGEQPFARYARSALDSL